MIFRSILILLLCSWSTFAAIEPSSGTAAHYVVSSGMTDYNAPFSDVDVLYGPLEKVNRATARWEQFTIRNSTNPLCTVRFLVPQNSHHKILRYQVLINTNATEYRDVNTGTALLPDWDQFEHYFLPQPARATAFMEGVPRSCTLLGHFLSLHTNVHGAAWQQWPNVKILDLNREVLVGTGRNAKDAEGHRLPQKPEKHEYTYVEFKADDYRTMIDAGINLFLVAPPQEKWVRDEPVFYLRPPDGAPALSFPADIYRANYLGFTMFMDEPAVLTVFDSKVQHVARSYDDMAQLVEMRTQATYLAAHPYGERCLENMFKNMGVNFGDMNLLQADFPAWETRLEYGFYEMRGGCNGIVHEGRYNVDSFNNELKTATGKNWNFSADALFKIHFALLRGAAAPFHKFWGTSIYGQCDPMLAPTALTTAYDMGARYFWFWTSDHDHHVPWPEQLALSRTLKEHVSQHTRQSIYKRSPTRDVAIALPDGLCFPFDRFDWVEAPTPQLKANQFAHLQAVRLHTLAAINQCLKRHEDFDITIDDGRRIDGYRRVIRIK